MPVHDKSSLAEYKRFIELVYEQKAFYVSPGGGGDSSEEEEEVAPVKRLVLVLMLFSRRNAFGFLMVLSTLSLAGTAAYYSVFGLSSLFAGAKTEVIIMATALEFAKLIVASYLHNNWDKIGWILKSWYVGNAQIDILRFFYRFNNYRLWMSFCEDSEKTAQELARKFDEKVDEDEEISFKKKMKLASYYITY